LDRFGKSLFCSHGRLTAGASAPEVLVQEVIERLIALGAAGVRDIQGPAEAIVFRLPKALAG